MVILSHYMKVLCNLIHLANVTNLLFTHILEELTCKETYTTEEYGR